MDTLTALLASPWGAHVPSCKKCGAPCQRYGGIGGYSVQCAACNERASARRREARAKLKGRMAGLQ